MLETAYSPDAAARADLQRSAQFPAAAVNRLLAEVAETAYRFTTPTPTTQQRYLDRSGCTTASSLRDIFGWNLPFEANTLSPSMLQHMRDAGVLMQCVATQTSALRKLPGRPRLYQSAVRIGSLDGDLFLHSGFPTEAPESVFFGPDTYRFARFVQHALQDTLTHQASADCAPKTLPRRILDLGCGTGAGGIVAARVLQQHGEDYCVTMRDINPAALHYTTVNAAIAGIRIQLSHGDALAALDGEFDLIVANPPYLFDDARRTYRHGGAGLGRALSVQFVKESLPRLAPGGLLLLYTGVAMVDGLDPFLTEVLPLVSQAGYRWSYAEIDPDVFGEELSRPMYQHVDRIAAIGLSVWRTLNQE